MLADVAERLDNDRLIQHTSCFTFDDLLGLTIAKTISFDGPIHSQALLRGACRTEPI
jgi:hypothetical protein